MKQQQTKTPKKTPKPPPNPGVQVKSQNLITGCTQNIVSAYVTVSGLACPTIATHKHVSEVHI